jgi:hypothetical protein
VSGRLVVASVAMLLGFWPVVADAQTLGEVARTTSARRKEEPKARKVYTNDNVRQDFTPSASPAPAGTPADATAGAPAAAPAAAAPPAAAPAAPAPDPAAAADAGKKDEAYWRQRMTGAREQLDRAQSFAAALESQINALTVDFLQRDDPAQRSTIESNRKKAIAEHERVTREIDGHKKAIAAVEDDARKAGVPPGWLRQ